MYMMLSIFIIDLIMTTNSVTCVHPNAYALFVASQTKNHVVYRQEMNSMNIFTIIISTNLKVTIIISIYFLLIHISKEYKSKPYS